MRTLRAIRERKTVIEGAKWREGKLPRNAFPLSKSRTYSLGNGWRWLLVAYDLGKAQYQAWLGLEPGSDQALLWSITHLKEGDIAMSKRGLSKKVGCGVVRHPKSQDGVRLCISDANAIGMTNFQAAGTRLQ